MGATNAPARRTSGWLLGGLAAIGVVAVSGGGALILLSAGTMRAMDTPVVDHPHAVFNDDLDRA